MVQSDAEAHLPGRDGARKFLEIRHRVTCRLHGKSHPADRTDKANKLTVHSPNMLLT